MKTIFKRVLIAVTLICTSTSLFAQSNEKKAEGIVKEILTAMGGMNNYNNTHFIQWDFVNRKLSWDKWTGDVRVENPTANQVILVNINSLKGKVYESGVLVTDETKANALLEKAKNWWINDSYWLVMPWKLQDPGVNLTYVKVGKLPNGKIADVLQLTFSAVGVTPDNKYWLYVDREDHLIKQWAHYINFNDAKPKFIKPWNNYQKVGNILLSFDRPNEEVGPKNVVVNTNLASSIFTKI